MRYLKFDLLTFSLTIRLWEKVIFIVKMFVYTVYISTQTLSTYKHLYNIHKSIMGLTVIQSYKQSRLRSTALGGYEKFRFLISLTFAQSECPHWWPWEWLLGWWCLLNTRKPFRWSSTDLLNKGKYLYSKRQEHNT